MVAAGAFQMSNSWSIVGVVCACVCFVVAIVVFNLAYSDLITLICKMWVKVFVLLLGRVFQRGGESGDN